MAGAFALRLINKLNENTAQQENTSTASEKASMSDDEAKKLLSDAEKARASGDYDGAKASYQKALDHYKEVKNTQKASELDATLSLVEVEKKNANATVKPRLAGEE
jgi:hypothetical protein